MLKAIDEIPMSRDNCEPKRSVAIRLHAAECIQLIHALWDARRADQARRKTRFVDSSPLQINHLLELLTEAVKTQLPDEYCDSIFPGSGDYARTTPEADVKQKRLDAVLAAIRELERVANELKKGPQCVETQS